MTQGAKFPTQKVRLWKNELQKRASDRAVEVGVLTGAGDHPSGEASIAEVALFNEFGTSSGGSSRSGGTTLAIPERPFMRTTVPKNKTELNMLIAKLLRGMLLGKISEEQAQAILGETFQAMVKRNIIELREPANAPKTIEKKGSANPLVDTGVLLNSIHWKRKA